MPKSLLHHRQDYQKILYDGMVKDLQALTGYISILKRHVRHVQRTNNFNETLFALVRKNYIETVDNFKYEFNLFKDAIVYRTKVLVDTKAEQFKKVSDVLRKEQGDTNMVIGQSLDLAFNMRDNIWPDIQSKLLYLIRMYQVTRMLISIMSRDICEVEEVIFSIFTFLNEVGIRI